MAQATAASRCTREDKVVIRAEGEDEETDVKVAILSREEEE